MKYVFYDPAGRILCVAQYESDSIIAPPKLTDMTGAVGMEQVQDSVAVNPEEHYYDNTGGQWVRTPRPFMRDAITMVDADEVELPPNCTVDSPAFGRKQLHGRSTRIKFQLQQDEEIQLEVEKWPYRRCRVILRAPHQNPRVAAKYTITEN